LLLASYRLEKIIISDQMPRHTWKRKTISGDYVGEKPLEAEMLQRQGLEATYGRDKHDMSTNNAMTIFFTPLLLQ
jgi:hypothetical protein